LRAAKREARWRIKYLVLGLGGVLLVRFYFLSQTALFNVTMASYLVTQATTLLIANMAISASLMRDRLGVELAVSRQVLYRSVVVGVLGVYLLAVGTLGWLLNSLGIAEGLGRPTEALRADQSMLASLKTAQTPLVLESDGVHQWLEPRVARVFTDGSVLVPLRWRDELTGFLLIGPERTGVSYTIEDLE